MGRAKQLIDIALAIANMNAPCWVSEKLGRLAQILKPTKALLLLNRHGRRID